MLYHVASIVAIFQLLQTNWIRVGRVRHSNSDYNPNRSLHLASAYNSGCCYCDKLQKTRTKGRWNEKSARVIEKDRKRESENMWNSNVRRAYGLRKSAGVTNESAGVKLWFVGFDSCEKSREKETGWKGRKTNLSGLSSAWMTWAERIQSPDTFTGFNELIKRIRVGEMRVNSEMYLSTPDMMKTPKQKASRGTQTIISEKTHVYACITIPSFQLAAIFTLWCDRAKARRKRSSQITTPSRLSLYPTLTSEVCALVRHPRWTYYLRSTDPVNVSIRKTMNFVT